MADHLKFQVNVPRVTSELTKLATFSDCADPSPAVTRVVFTDTDLRAREYLASLYRAAGLSVRVDAVGNTFARWIGNQPELAAIGTGSHTDAIPFSGMYDGTVGVLGGLEAIRSDKTGAERVLLLVRTTPLEECERRTDGMTLLMAELQRPEVAISAIDKALDKMQRQFRQGRRKDSE